jgi:cyclopropane-fatty-acyl-phospholipid synthase
VPDTRNNRKAVGDHYSLGDDFYLTFIDKKYRIYSHGHFRSEDETLERSQEHKLEDMFSALRLQPGMRLLDIGGGWGPVPQYCGERGVQVTSLTLAPDSQSFIQRLIDQRNLPCEVRLEDFLDHRPEKPYDAVVIFGVIEHIPQYKRFVAKVWDLLKTGGLMYLDASASRLKYNMGAITKKHIWTTTCAYLSLHDLIAELNYHGMDILEVKNESRDYELTMLHWAHRFDQAKDFIVANWGERLYRMFRLYLWGGHVNFRHDGLQAYRVLTRRSDGRGPRPGLLRRAMLAAQSAW